MKSHIHKTTIVSKKSKIGLGTKIWQWCHIMDGVEIGQNCTLGQNVFLGKNVKIGNNVKIQNNVSIFEGVNLEDDVFCGPSVVFTNVKNPRSKFKTYSKDYSQTLICKGATLGANSTILCGNKIGKFSFIGAGSVVTKDVKDFSLSLGNPAKHKGWVCYCGKKISKNKIKKNICRNCQ